MTNEQLKSKYEKKGFKVKSCVAYTNGVQTIIEYHLCDTNGRIIKTAKSLSALLR